MSTYESSVKSLLQGVSQQLPAERLPGQLTSQVNMVSDPVTGLRRRPPVTYKTDWAWEDADAEHLRAWFTDLAGDRVHVLLNTNTGNIRILGEDFVEQANLNGGAYLTNADPSRIRAATVGNELFLANLDVIPALQYSNEGTNPNNAGFFYVVAGAFGKTYSVSIVHADGSINATYTTPGGTGAGDAAVSTPEYIADNLADQLKLALSVSVDMTDIRILSWNFEDVGSPALQKNTGTASAPVWVTVVANDEFPLTDVEQQKLRVRWTSLQGDGTESIPGSVTITFEAKVDGVWQTTDYTTNPITLSWSRSTDEKFKTLPVSAFTNVSSSGDPLLYVAVDGPYVYVTRSGSPITVSTNVGTQYLIASQSGFVTSEGNLPARLPPAADGYIVRVGTGNSPKYYEFVVAKTEWVETAAYGSPSGIGNMPVSIYWDGSAWALNVENFDGRNAGDDVTNKAHAFMSEGITGLATYQGRLIILSGALVSASQAQGPRNFFRTTVTSVLSSDPFEIGSGLNSAAAYEWAISFQKDLILFSRAYQAVIPSGNQAVTPTTATVVPTSGHDVDTTSSPINLGRTLMFCNPRSESFFGVMEMVPSQYTDSQYVSQDSTAHLPKYMGGRCRFAVSSGVASMAMFAPSGDPSSLIVHEYHWSADTKDQQAWHQWLFQYPVAQAYFVGDVSVIAFVQNEHIVLGTVDARAGAVDQDGVRRPFLDLNVAVPFTGNEITIPAWMLAFEPDIAGELVAVSGIGALAGELIGTSVSDPNTLTTVLSWPEGTAVLGLPYRGSFIPTPPQTTDYQGEVVHDGKATLLRYVMGTRNSSDFTVEVSDAYSQGEPIPAPVLTFSSPELDLDRGLYADIARSIIPCRTDMRSTAMEVYTDGQGELNVTSLEYVARFNPKIKRR